MPRGNKRKRAGKRNQKLAVVKAQVTKLSEGIAKAGIEFRKGSANSNNTNI